MSVRRVMGTETEYAVSAPGLGHYNPVRLSFDVVGAAADEKRSHIRWDYRQEDPVNDARGTRLSRAAAHPDLLTDAPQRRKPRILLRLCGTTMRETSSCGPPLARRAR